jgi:hypothetical protein
MKERQHALPQWGVHETSMSSIWAIHIEGIKELSHCIIARMAPRAFLDALVYVQLIIDLLAHPRRVDKKLQGYVSPMTGATISELVQSRQYPRGMGTHLKSRASHTVELEPKPSLPTTWYRS